MTLTRDELEAEVARARAARIDENPRDLLRWARDLLGADLMMSTAFGKTGMVILHIVRDAIPDLPIYFLDTGFHFQETLDFAASIRDSWGLDIRFHRPRLYGDRFKEEFGADLYETDPDLCCHKNKVEPFAELIDRYRGWVAGIRRDQSSSRAGAESLEILEANKLKVQPLVLWTRARVEKYIARHDIPLHPLFAQGYTSIGCAPCTRPCALADGSAPADERAGRWAGTSKTECGLHLFWKKQKTAAPGAEAEGAAAPPASSEDARSAGGEGADGSQAFSA